MNKYDGLYIFTGAVKDDGLDALVEKATAELTRLNGKIISTDVIGKKTFARPMSKKDSGIYVKIRFEMDGANIAALINRYHLSEDVFRVQILAVDERREKVLAEQASARKMREEAREAAKAKAEAEAAGSFGDGEQA